MKQIQYILLLTLSLFLMCSCYDDDSTLADLDITEISIKNNVGDTINLYLGDNISISTEGTTVNENTTWKWGMGVYQTDNITKKVTTVFKEIATTSNLEYKTNKLGHYYLRLVVTNEFGSSVKYYHIFVNSEFEEGILILGKKEDGKGSLAFMKTLTPEETAQGLKPGFRQNLFAYTNGGKELDIDPIDCDKIDQYLYIMCGKAQKLLQLNAKSFQLQFEFDFKNYASDFIPLNMISYDSKYCRNIYATSKNGGVANVQMADLEIFPFTEVPQNIVFDRAYDRPNRSSSIKIAFISSATSTIYGSGFNPATMKFEYFPCYDFFNGRTIIQTFFDEDGNLLVYNQQDGVYKITKIGSSIGSFETMGLDLIYDKVCDVNTGLLTASSQLFPNDPNSCLFFSNQNRIYKWAYNQSEIPADAFITLPDNEIIKCINQSTDQKQLYLATYNPQRTGLKGSLYIYDVDSGKIIGKPHESVADEPIKVMYKIK